VRNEGTDCEIYALHAARSIKLNLFKEHHWAELENRVRQKQFFEDEDDTPEPAPVAATEAPGTEAAVQAEPEPEPKAPPAPPPAAKKQNKPAPRRAGYSATSW
jgi:phage terminase large subunit GpA-like protein